MNYLDIKLNNKYYVQRTEHSKIIEFDEENKKNNKYNSYDELPKDIQEEIIKVLEIRKNPKKHFAYVIEPRTFNAAITFYNELGVKNLFIPETIDGFNVTELRKIEEMDEEPIERIIIPDSVNNLGESLCAGNHSLQEVILSPNITKISKGCFIGCINLSKINLENVELIGSSAFYACQSLTTLNLNKLKLIEPNGLQNCKNIEELNMPEIKGLYGSALSDNDKLQKITLGEKLKYIGQNVFRNCLLLDNVHLPSNITYIKEGTFENCKNLKTITLPDKLENIEMCAFGLSGLEGTITFPETLRSIGAYAFAGCPIKKINICKTTNFKDNSFSIDKNDIFVYNADKIIEEER